MKGANAIVAGTGFENRAGVISKFCKPGSPVYLVREPNNTFDRNAIAVYIDARLCTPRPAATIPAFRSESSQSSKPGIYRSSDDGR